MSEPIHDPIRVSTRQGYDRWASFYDDEDNPLVALEHEHITRFMEDVDGKRVLDAGCGTGRHAVELVRRGALVTAIDFSPEMLARARMKVDADRVEFLQHDLERSLPCPDHCFELVISGLVIDHIADLEGFFSELRRVCRPQGSVVATVMHPALTLRGAQARFTDPDTGILTLPDSHRHGIADYVNAILHAGLSIRRMSEHVVDDALVSRSHRALRYLGWPMLLVFELTP